MTVSPFIKFSFLSLLTHSTELVANGEDRQKVVKHNKEIREVWNTMTLEEKIECTRESTATLEQRREKKKHTSRKTTLGCFHDTRGTLMSIEAMVSASSQYINLLLNRITYQLKELHQRTKTHMILFAVRHDMMDFFAPHTWSSDTAVEEFFQMSFGVEVGQFAVKLESYMLSGVPGASSFFMINSSPITLCYRSTEISS